MTSPTSKRPLAPHAAARNVARPLPQRRRASAAFFLGLCLGLIVLLLLTGITAIQLRFANRVFPGVRVAGVDLSELTRAQAAARLQEQLTPYQGPRSFCVLASKPGLFPAPTWACR